MAFTPTRLSFNPVTGNFDQVLQDVANKVTVGISGAMFTDIQDAIDSITDATVNKQYAVKCFPGQYTGNITLKPFVHLVGETNGPGAPTIIGKVTANFTNAGEFCVVNRVNCIATVASDGETVHSLTGAVLINDAFFQVTTDQDYGFVAIEQNATTGQSILYSSQLNIVSSYVGSTKNITAVKQCGGSFPSFMGLFNLDVQANAASGTIVGREICGTGPYFGTSNTIFINIISAAFAGDVVGSFVSTATSAFRVASGEQIRLLGSGAGTAIGFQIDTGTVGEMFYSGPTLFIEGFANQHRADAALDDTHKIWLLSENASLPDIGTGLNLVTPHDEKKSGFSAWGDSGNYWSYDTGTREFTLLRRAAGIVDHAPIDIPAPQTVTLPDLAVSYVYADDKGVLQHTTNPVPLYEQGIIVLFEVWVQGTNYIVAKENHPFKFTSAVSQAWHNLFGSLLQEASQTLATASAANRTVNVVGNNVLTDHGLDTDVLAQSPATWIQTVTGTSGLMYKIGEQAGIITRKSDPANTTGTLVSNGRVIVFRLGVLKNSLNSTTAQFVSHADSVDYANAAQARNAVTSGAVAPFPAELQNLEICQLGYVAITANGTGGGTIAGSPITALQVFGAQFVGGGVSASAGLVTTDTTNFDGVLSGADSNVQLALETIDDMLADAEPGTVSSSTSGQIGTSNQAAREDHNHDLGTHAHTDNTNGGQLSTASISGFTEAVQDDVGGILADTNTINLTYNDGTPSIVGDVRYQDSNTVNLSDDAGGLKADLVYQQSPEILLTEDASGLKARSRVEKNYILNPDAEIDLSNVTTSGTITLARTTTVGEVLYRSASFKISNYIAGAYIEWTLDTLDPWLVGKPLYFRLKTRGLTSYVASDFYAVIHDGTSEIASSKVDIAGGDYEAKNFFIPESGKTYTLRLVAAQSRTAEFSADLVQVDEQENQFTNVITDWQLYTPTFGTGFGTVTAIEFMWRRSGDSIEIKGVATTGTVTTGAATISLPSGLFCNVPAASNRAAFGRVAANTSGATPKSMHINAVNGGSLLYVDDDAFSVPNTNTIFTSNQIFTVDATVPIVGWSSNIQVADRALEQYVSHDGTNIVLGINGAVIPTTTPSGTADAYTITSGFTDIQPTDCFISEIQQGGVGPWLTDSIWAQPLTFDGTNYLGFGVSSTSGVVQLVRGKYRLGASAIWASITAGTRWRVRKVSGGAQVGFPINSRNIIGDTSGTAVPAGLLGEAIGTLRSGTGGVAYQDRTATAVTAVASPGTVIISETLNKGNYIATFTGSFQQGSGSTRTLQYLAYIGGTAVTGIKYVDCLNNTAVTTGTTVVFDITADGTVFDIRGYWNSAATSTLNSWELAIVRR